MKAKKLSKIRKHDMKSTDFLTELSTEKLAQYKTAAAADANKADKAGDFKKGDKRFKGINTATKKQFDNDAKKVDETVGLPYPGTYEETNDMFKGSGQRRVGTLTTEANPNQQLSKYNPNGKTYRGVQNKMPTLKTDPVDNAVRWGDDDTGSYEQNFGKEEMKRIIAKHLDLLDEKQKKVLKLRFWDGMTTQEVASVLNVSQSRITQIENKAMIVLKVKFHKSGITPDSVDIDEGWSQKYKKSINCSHPKGFSQKAHCAGKKKHNESIDNVMEMTCPDCGMCKTHGDHENLDEACWKGYHKEGNKKMFGKTYPNCVKNENVAEGKITLSTDPNWYGATVDNYQASGPVVNIPANQLVGFEPDDKMNQPKSKVNVEKIVAGLKQGDKLPPLLVRKYKNGYQVLDGHHRFWAYKLLGVKSIPAQIVPAEDVEEIGKQGVTEEQHSCPHCGGELVSEELMNEKKDACYYKVKSRYKVWPSAYASGALVKCRKKGADSWGNGGKKNESSILEGLEQVDENLHKWFKEKWVRFGPDGKIRGACARGNDSEGKPKCLPQSKAHNLGKKGRASAAARKRREDPNPDRHGKAINVNTKKETKG
jgi:RNA polymerase sigma factor (sigma-70 family)